MTLDNSRPLESVLEKLDDAVTNDTASVDNILTEFGDRSFGPILVLSGTVMISPLGAIPGVPVVMAALIISSSLQLIFGRKKPWLPERIRRLKIPGKKVHQSKIFFRPYFKKVDGLVRPRMPWAATRTTRLTVAIVSIFLAMALLILAALPLGGLIPGALIAMFGLGIMARDGLVLSLTFGLVILMIGVGFLAT